MRFSRGGGCRGIKCIFTRSTPWWDKSSLCITMRPWDFLMVGVGVENVYSPGAPPGEISYLFVSRWDRETIYLTKWCSWWKYTFYPYPHHEKISWSHRETMSTTWWDKLSLCLTVRPWDILVVGVEVENVYLQGAPLGEIKCLFVSRWDNLSHQVVFLVKNTLSIPTPP